MATLALTLTDLYDISADLSCTSFGRALSKVCQRI